MQTPGQKGTGEKIYSRRQTTGGWKSGGHQLSRQRNLETKWLQMGNSVARKPVCASKPQKGMGMGDTRNLCKGSEELK